jgi:hypothetical protein
MRSFEGKKKKKKEHQLALQALPLSLDSRSSDESSRLTFHLLAAI